MLEIARAKTGAFDEVTFSHGDAAAPQLAERTYDVVLCRHVLWALPDPADALQRWSGLLCPGGRIVLIEGRWSTGVGLARQETATLLAAAGWQATIERLDDPRYWGGPIGDDRYAAVGRS